jgi:hypothetical protein
VEPVAPVEHEPPVTGHAGHTRYCGTNSVISSATIIANINAIANTTTIHIAVNINHNQPLLIHYYFKPPLPLSFFFLFCCFFSNW